MEGGGTAYAEFYLLPKEYEKWREDRRIATVPELKNFKTSKSRQLLKISGYVAALLLPEFPKGGHAGKNGCRLGHELSVFCGCFASALFVAIEFLFQLLQFRLNLLVFFFKRKCFVSLRHRKTSSSTGHQSKRAFRIGGMLHYLMRIRFPP
jgi:hypothetical protein